MKKINVLLLAFLLLSFWRMPSSILLTVGYEYGKPFSFVECAESFDQSGEFYGGERERSDG